MHTQALSALVVKRRSVLCLSVLGFISRRVPAKGALDKAPSARLGSSDILVDELLTVFKYPHNAAILGQLYLNDNPRFSGHQVLLSAIGVNTVSLLDPIGIFEQRRAQDYQHGRTIILGGWVLSVTEVSLCCVAAIRASRLQ